MLRVNYGVEGFSGECGGEETSSARDYGIALLRSPPIIGSNYSDAADGLASEDSYANRDPIDLLICTTFCDAFSIAKKPPQIQSFIWPS
jgi:hypothetical protein